METRPLCVLLCWALLVGGVNLTSGAGDMPANVLRNPGFEQPGGTKGPRYLAEAWRLIWLDPEQLAECGVVTALDTAVRHGGARSLKVQSLQEPCSVSFFQGHYPAAGGQTWVLSVWCRSYNEYPGEFPVRLSVWCSGDFGERDTISRIRSFGSTAEWQRFILEITCPEGTKTVQPVLEFRHRDGTGGVGTVWFDDAEFVRTSQATDN